MANRTALSGGIGGGRVSLQLCGGLLVSASAMDLKDGGAFLPGFPG
jgi:hypothetical protein